MTQAPRSIGEYTISDIERILAADSPDIAPSEHAERNAAVAMILRESPAGRLETLFIQRAEYPGDPWSGHMAFPGGRHESHDPSLPAAARRETFEEVGLQLEEDMELGRLPDIYGGRLKEYSLAVSPFVYHHPNPPELVLNHEVADAVWVPLDYLGDPQNIVPYSVPIDPFHRDFPSFQYESYTIWGLTYRILANYFSLFGVNLPGEPEVTDVE